MSLVNAPVERETRVVARGERSRLRRIVLLMISGSLALAAVFGRHGLLDAHRYRAERDRLRQEIADMESQQRRLVDDLAAIRKDPSALERIAREELTLGMPGEIVVFLPPEEPAGVAHPAQPRRR